MTSGGGGWTFLLLAHARSGGWSAPAPVGTEYIVSYCLIMLSYDFVRQAEPLVLYFIGESGCGKAIERRPVKLNR